MENEKKKKLFGLNNQNRKKEGGLKIIAQWNCLNWKITETAGDLTVR